MKRRLGVINRRDIFIFLVQLYFFLLPLEYVLATSMGTVNRYISILIIITALVFTPRLKVKAETFLILFWLGYCVLSFIWAESKGGWTHMIVIYALNILLFSVVNSLDFSESEYNKIQNSYVIGAIILVIYVAFSDSVKIDKYSGRAFLMVGDGYYDPNYMAAVLIIPLGIAYKRGLKALEEKNKLMTAGMIAVCLAFLYVFIFSGSRGGFLGAAAAVFAITVFSLKKAVFRKRFFVLVAILCVIAVIVIPLVPEQLAERFTLESLTGQTDSGSGRLQIWAAAIKAIGANPIIGYGAGNTTTAIGAFFTANVAVHNLVLALWIETGVFSFLVLFCFVRLLKKSYENKDYLECSVWLGILVASLFLDAVSTRYLWSAFMIVSMRKNISYRKAQLSNCQRAVCSDSVRASDTGCASLQTNSDG